MWGECILEQKKLSTILNFSNQANYTDVDYADLYQYNLVVIFGEGNLSMSDYLNTKIPLCINVCKSGELEISSAAGEEISSGNNINIYSDIKVSNSTK